MEMRRNTSESDDRDRIKKAYERPQLIVYGDIREITQNVGKNGKLDGGAGMTANSLP